MRSTHLRGRVIRAPEGSAYSPPADAVILTVTDADGDAVPAFRDVGRTVPAPMPDQLSPTGEYSYWYQDGIMGVNVTISYGGITQTVWHDNPSPLSLLDLPDDEIQPLVNRMADLLGLDIVMDDYDQTQPAPAAA